MEDPEKEKAFAAFDQHKADLTVLHEHAARIGDTALTASLNVHHTHLQETWSEYLASRGWTESASEANRSGGEDKPPKEEEPEAPGTGG